MSTNEAKKRGKKCQAARSKTFQRAPETPERDLILLREYGFDLNRMVHAKSNEAAIKKLNLRQLDRLKLLLLRSEPYTRGQIPRSVREGIGRNSSRAFAQALTFLPRKIATADRNKK